MLPTSADNHDAAWSPARRPPTWTLVLLICAALALVVGFGVTGELNALLLAGANIAPFAALAVVAQLGERYGWARVLTYVVALGVLFLGLVVTAFSVFAALLFQAGVSVAAVARADPGIAARALVSASVVFLLGLVVVGFIATVFLPPGRRLAERLLPIRRNSLSNTTGLVVLLATAALALISLAWLRGQPLFLVLLGAENVGEQPMQRPQDVLYALVWYIPAAFVMVGYPFKRNLGAATTRLGLVWPSWKQVIVGLGAGLVLIGVVYALDYGLAQVFGAFGWPRTDSKGVERLFSGLVGPLGIAAVSISAGVGEELLARGVLQPRLGLLVANLGFTMAHGFQYSYDGLIIVFVVGLALGLLRLRTNTVTCAITHAAYDALALMASAAGH